MGVEQQEVDDVRDEWTRLCEPFEQPRFVIARIAVPAVSGAVGIAGGILLGRNALQRNRKVLGIPVPSKVDLSGVSQHIGEASRQFGKLAGEVRTAAGEVRSVREKAEQIGKVLG